MNDFEDERFYWVRRRYEYLPPSFERWEPMEWVGHWVGIGDDAPVPDDDILEVSQEIVPP